MRRRKSSKRGSYRRWPGVGVGGYEIVEYETGINVAKPSSRKSLGDYTESENGVIVHTHNTGQNE